MTRWTRPVRRRALLAGGAVAALSACAAATPRVARLEAENPPRGRFVEAEGLRVHFVEMGDPEAPPVVLIHGATGNLNDMTFDLAPRLAARCRVVAFDRPGFGYTERPEVGGWDPAVQARILRGAAAALGLIRPVVVGHSWGGAVAMAWGVEARDAVRGLVAVSGATMPWGDGEDGLFTPLVTSRAAAALGIGMVRLFTLRDDGAAAAARIFRPQSPPQGYLEHLQAELILRPASFRANTEDIQRLDGALTRLSRRYGAVSAPLEVLHGGADRIVGAEVHARALAARVPGARLEVAPGVGHMLHHARPNMVADAVDRLHAAG